MVVISVLLFSEKTLVFGGPLCWAMLSVQMLDLWWAILWFHLVDNSVLLFSVQTLVLW